MIAFLSMFAVIVTPYAILAVWDHFWQIREWKRRRYEATATSEFYNRDGSRIDV